MDKKAVFYLYNMNYEQLKEEVDLEKLKEITLTEIEDKIDVSSDNLTCEIPNTMSDTTEHSFIIVYGVTGKEILNQVENIESIEREILSHTPLMLMKVTLLTENPDFI